MIYDLSFKENNVPFSFAITFDRAIITVRVQKSYPMIIKRQISANRGAEARITDK